MCAAKDYATDYGADCGQVMDLMTGIRYGRPSKVWCMGVGLDRDGHVRYGALVVGIWRITFHQRDGHLARTRTQWMLRRRAEVKSTSLVVGGARRPDSLVHGCSRDFRW